VPSTDRPFQALFFALAVGLLGQTLATSNGHQNDLAMRELSITLVLALVGLCLPDVSRFSKLTRVAERATLAVVALGLAWQFAMLMHNAPGIYLQPRTGWQTLWFLLGLSSAAVLAGAGLSDSPLLGKYRMPVVLIIHFLLGCWLISASPRPVIDVDLIQRESVSALLDWKNPYELTFQNIYGSTAFFGSNIADAQRINVGFPYPPLSLLLAFPGQALLGDYRYGQLASMTCAGALMAYSRPGKLSAAIATLFLFTPRVFFVLEQGWTDPFLVLLASGTVFAAIRRPAWVPWLFGLLVVVKQYAVLALGFSWVLQRPFEWRAFAQKALKAAAIGAGVTLPFFLWNPKAFFFSVGGAHGDTPFRPDALTFPAWLWTAADQQQRWSSVGTIALSIAFGLAAWRTARTPSGFAAAMAIVFFGFFSFGGHAFCNHYYSILGLLALAAATATNVQAETNVEAERSTAS
jgi:hypothetical protein